ncbi:RNA polymerase sigma-70 factor [Georgenia sp. AZ-5]|uniref:RNA polymerase sigma-70 factor n=1 Tax=Georgenia sp. AZ-5 TaxID=3367526 RepID=UPI0037548073
MADLAALHDRLRPLMFSVAYRMLGSVADAEDVVQEAFVRLHRAFAGEVIDSPEAFATTVTTRLALDALRSARRRREHYVGTWLPEPLVAADPDPAHRQELDDTVSVAFLAVLERLSPAERAVFLLREVFGYGYGEIAQVVGRNETACRQLMARARRHVAEARPRYESSRRRRAELAEAFFAAARDGDLPALERVLAEDVTFHADGGGRAPAIRAPLRGRVPVARFVRGLARRAAPLGVRLEVTGGGGQPAAVLRGPDGAVLGVLGVDVADGQITAVYNQINPDKLGHLGPVGDMYALLG